MRVVRVISTSRRWLFRVRLTTFPWACIDKFSFFKVIFTFFAFMGIAGTSFFTCSTYLGSHKRLPTVTSAGHVIYGEILWDPLTLIDRYGYRIDD